MRRSAGAFVRRRQMELMLPMVAGAGALGGLGVGQALPPLIGIWFDGVWRSVAVTVVVMVALGVFWLVFRSLERGRLKRWEKGEDAEVRTGHAIEYAVTAPDCAVAHSVTEIARVGDIDHLVATPVRLWVIETKYRRVPPKQFPKVLQRLAANTTAVRAWAPAGTPVRGCLVLARESRINRKTYDSGNESIAAHTPESLWRELRAEAGRKREVDGRVAADIWKLGQIVE